jgi:hypothetical protein
MTLGIFRQLRDAAATAVPATAVPATPKHPVAESEKPTPPPEPTPEPEPTLEPTPELAPAEPSPIEREAGADPQVWGRQMRTLLQEARAAGVQYPMGPGPTRDAYDELRWRALLAADAQPLPPVASPVEAITDRLLLREFWHANPNGRLQQDFLDTGGTDEQLLAMLRSMFHNEGSQSNREYRVAYKGGKQPWVEAEDHATSTKQRYTTAHLLKRLRTLLGIGPLVAPEPTPEPTPVQEPAPASAEPTPARKSFWQLFGREDMGLRVALARLPVLRDNITTGKLSNGKPLTAAVRAQTVAEIEHIETGIRQSMTSGELSADQLAFLEAALAGTN